MSGTTCPIRSQHLYGRNQRGAGEVTRFHSWISRVCDQRGTRRNQLRRLGGHDLADRTARHRQAAIKWSSVCPAR